MPPPQDFVQQGDILVFNANLTYFKDKFLGGAHDVKFGAEHRRGKLFQGNYRAGDVERRYQNGNAYRVIAYNTPVEQVARNYSLAGYVQDSIRVSTKLTLNLGLRTEWWRGDVPEQSNAGGAFPEIFGPVRHLPGAEGRHRVDDVLAAAGRGLRRHRRQPGGAQGVLRPLLLPGADLGPQLLLERQRARDGNLRLGRQQSATTCPTIPSEFGTLRSLNLPRLPVHRSRIWNRPTPTRSTASVELGLTPLSSFATRYTYRKNSKIIAATDLALPDSAFSIPSTAIDPLTGDTLNYWSLGPEYATVVNQEVLTQFDNNYNALSRRRFHLQPPFRRPLAADRVGDAAGQLRPRRQLSQSQRAGDLRLRRRTASMRSALGEDRHHVRAAVEAAVRSFFYRYADGMNSNNQEVPEHGPQGPGPRRDHWHALSAPGRGAGRASARTTTNIFDIRLSRKFRFGAPRSLEAARRRLQHHQRQQHPRDGDRSPGATSTCRCAS